MQEAPLFDVLTPAPTLAGRDIGDIYDRGCVNDPRDTRVRRCLAGDPDGRVVVPAVGDSKVAQWVPALQTIAEDHGWRLEIYLKSGCPLTSAVTLDAAGEPYEGCTDWGQAVLARLACAPPDAGGDLGGRLVALDAAGDYTVAGLTAGFTDVWRRLAGAGVHVVAISDTPGAQALRTPECVAAHTEDPNSACAWVSSGGEGSPALRAAAAEVAGATYGDMNPWVCPEGGATVRRDHS
ncbi:MAG: SGNH hydrolase domain-containing protein [Ornithinimicrobium sp.]|uniref:SGNH hydrolase domain-containing protein n=1 Tax=Ornithinimicrobium sp. TaxID=1977084 RepID=UPI003D9B44F0